MTNSIDFLKQLSEEFGLEYVQLSRITALLYYPNFYKMYTEGWSFQNSYSPRNSCSTGNNEMSGMISLFSIYRTCTANDYKNNIYNESIFGLFNQAGYNTSSTARLNL